MSGGRRAYVALGTNLAHEGREGRALLQHALSALDRAGVGIVHASRAWRTAAWPQPSTQPDYLNAAISIEVRAHTPGSLYDVLRAVESAFGRERRERWGARTLDLDIIDFDGFAGTFNGIIVPHPRTHLRAFVLVPLAEIAPDWRHPQLKKSAAELRAELGDDQRIAPEPGGALWPRP